MRRTLRQLSLYLSHVPAIVAREAMLQAMASSMPHMEEESRMELLNSWSLAATGKPIDTGDRISMDEFKEEIKRRVV